MSAQKILGTETEYGIIAPGDPEFDPIANSILLVNNFLPPQSSKILWDYDQESPLNDARGFVIEHEQTPPTQEENTALNKTLINGARYYVDHAHPEYSTPECSNIIDLVRYEKAGEQILEISMMRANALLPPDKAIRIYKNNSDQKGNSYGYHENYLMDRSVPFDKISRELIPFLVTRQIFTGAGKVGSENNAPAVNYQISQRADFFETEVGLDTMAKRPIINTRDEPHADKSKYRRLHVIVGDSNMSEYTTLLKVGTTAIMLSMIQDGFIQKDFSLENPVKAIHQISHDSTCKKRVELAIRKRLSPVEIQKEYLELAVKHCQQTEGDELTHQVLKEWEFVLGKLEREPMELCQEIDWVIKKNLITSYMDKHSLGWNDPRVAMLDLQYHDIRRDRGLYHLLERQGRVRRILDDSDIAPAITDPPADTRAYFRGMCQKKYGSDIFGINWDSISFNVGGNNIKRIMMSEPAKGTKMHVEELIDSCPDTQTLISKLLT
jgi:proteasome accessory factor A